MAFGLIIVLVVLLFVSQNTVKIVLHGASGEELIDIYTQENKLEAPLVPLVKGFNVPKSVVTLKYSIPSASNHIIVHFLNDAKGRDVFIKDISINNKSVLSEVGGKVFLSLTGDDVRQGAIKKGKLLWSGEYTWN